MSLFSHTPKHTQHALIVDIGSGSVGLAIVRSSAGEAAPVTLWSHREHSLIKDVDTTSLSMREISTAIVNAFLKFGNDGRKALEQLPERPSIDYIQIAICAPWTYTVTKTVHYTEENPFTITDTLIEELAAVASKKALEAVLQQSLLSSSGLATIDNQTVGILANEYALTSHVDVQTKDVTLIQLTAISQQRILETLREVTGKVLPRVPVTTHSFMYIFFDVLRQLYPDTQECCLIDITNEATEIGIVRDNILRYSSHAPYGAYTLAREIAAMADIPKEEAYAYLRGGSAFVLSKLTAAKERELNAIIVAYEEKIAALFQQTGDTLAIPKTIYLHRDTDSEAFFVEHITKAAHMATKMDHTIYPITTALLAEKEANGDSALVLATHYFHLHGKTHAT